VRLPPRGIVLTAPFTSMADIAANYYGPLVEPILTERWDNAARLAELGALAPGRPPLVIVHGRDDEVIPFRFGERLAATAPWARFVPVPGGRHNDLYDVAPDVIRRAMAEVAHD
jgi:pimeloyl-ACP methyl ester carboxylesterase